MTSLQSFLWQHSFVGDDHGHRSSSTRSAGGPQVVVDSKGVDRDGQVFRVNGDKVLTSGIVSDR